MIQIVRAFFDTNIWLDFCWRKIYSSSRGKKKKPAILINRLRSRKIKVILTLPLLYEITSHFKDYFIIQDIIADGFSIYELKKVRGNYKLKEEDRIKIDEIFSFVISLPSVKEQLLIEWIDDKIFQRAFRSTNRYDLELIDSLHVEAAVFAKCDLFVTKDERLIDQVKIASKYEKRLKKVKFIKPSEFSSNHLNLFRK